MNKSLTTLLLSTTLLAGCAKHAAAPVPGAISQFDSDAYTTLRTARAAIDQTKLELVQGSFTEAETPSVKQAVNAAVTAYNFLDVTYQSYHAAAVAGTATVAEQQAVTSGEADLATAISALTTPKGK